MMPRLTSQTAQIRLVVDPPNRESEAARRKRAELVSTLGAGALGTGLGLLLAQYIATYAVPLLLLGAGLHGWGMLTRHRLDKAGGAQLPRWVDALYWLCWFALLVLPVYVVFSILSS